MKTLFLVLAMVLYAAIGQAQFVAIDYDEDAYPLTTYTMDGDTTYVFKMLDPYYFTFQFVYTGLDATDGYAKVGVGMDGVNFSDYNLDSLLFDVAAGSGIIRDTDNGTSELYIQIEVFNGTCTTGTLDIEGNLTKKQR